MDPIEEQLRQVLDAGVDLWSVIDTAIAVAARDHPADLRLRREGIVQSLYAFTPCPNCDPNRSILTNGHGAGSTRANGSAASLANGHGRGSGAGYGVEASPEMRPVSPSPSPKADASPEMGLEFVKHEDEKRTEIKMEDLISIKEFLQDPMQRTDVESLIAILQNLVEGEVTYEVLIHADITRQVSALRKHQCEEVRMLAKQIVSKWKELVNAHMKPSSACDSSSPPVPIENGSPQKIPAKSHHQNSSGPHEFMRSPKRLNGAGPSGRGGSDLVHSRAGSGPRSEPPTKPNSNGRVTIPSSAPPAKRKEREDSLAEQARLDSARRRLQENYQEAQNAKKQRTVQVMSLNEIPKPRNGFIRRGGSTSRNR